jgi:hypothetical protein
MAAEQKPFQAPATFCSASLSRSSAPRPIIKWRAGGTPPMPPRMVLREPQERPATLLLVMESERHPFMPRAHGCARLRLLAWQAPGYSWGLRMTLTGSS